MSFHIGLTGNIGSGKTTAGYFFQQCGATVIEADAINRTLLQENQGIQDTIIDHFGAHIATTSQGIDTSKLREIIFNNPAEKEWLESLLHPHIRAHIHIAQQQSTSRYTVTILPLLNRYTATLYAFDIICVMLASTSNKQARTCARDSIDPRLFSAMLATQPDDTSLQQMADHVIMNNGSLADLKTSVRALDALWPL